MHQELFGIVRSCLRGPEVVYSESDVVLSGSKVASDIQKLLLRKLQSCNERLQACIQRLRICIERLQTRLQRLQT